MTPNELRIERAKKLRCKRPALQELGWYDMISKLEEIRDASDEYRYAFESESILNALDGDSEAEQEFRLTFSCLSEKAERLGELMHEVSDERGGSWYDCQWYDDHLVSLLGNRYTDMYGFDEYEEDYYSLVYYERTVATEGAQKRICRETKSQLIDSIGQCLGIVLAFLDLQYQYEYLKSAFDVLLGENTALLHLIDSIDEAYEEDSPNFDIIIKALPEWIWVTN